MQWSSITAVSHLVAVGAGVGDVLAQCLNCKPANTLIFEADVAQAQLLAGEYQHSQACTIKPLAVTAAAGTSQLHRFNLPQCNALSAATSELNTIFPGLQALPVKELQTVELAAELVSAKVQGQNNMLLLEVPAQNLSLLQHLADKNLLAHFSHLVIQHSEQVLYQGGATLAQVQQFLAEHGFEQQELDTSDADFPLLRFYRDAKAEQLKQAQQQLQQAERQLAKLQAEQVEAQQQAEQKLAQLSENLKIEAQEKRELTKQLQFESQERNALVEQLKAVTELLATEQQIVKQLEARLVLVVEQEEKLKSEKELNKQLAKEIESLNSTVESVKQHSSMELDKLKAKNSELVKELESTTVKVSQIENELSAAKNCALTSESEYLVKLKELDSSKEKLKIDLSEQIKINQACNSLLLKMNMYLSKDNK